MRLDGDLTPLIAERRPDADVCHRRMKHPIHLRGGGIDTVRWNQLVISADVGCREAEVAPASLPLNHHSVDTIMMAQQRARLIHPPFADQAADARAADNKVLVAHRIDLFCTKAVSGAERAHDGKIAGAIAPEEKVCSNPDFGDAHPLHQHAADKRFRIPP